MRALQFTPDRGPGAYHTTYSRQFRAKTYTKRNFLHLMKEILHRGHLLLL
jgi:hypothetical protein